MVSFHRWPSAISWLLFLATLTCPTASVASCVDIVSMASKFQPSDVLPDFVQPTDDERYLWRLVAAKVPARVRHLNHWTNERRFLSSLHACRPLRLVEFFCGIGNCVASARAAGLPAIGIDLTVGFELHNLMNDEGYKGGCLRTRVFRNQQGHY